MYWKVETFVLILSQISQLVCYHDLLRSDLYQLISVKFGMMMDMTKLYILIPV